MAGDTHEFGMTVSIPISITGTFEGDPMDFDPYVWVMDHPDEVREQIRDQASDIDVDEVAMASDLEPSIDGYESVDAWSQSPEALGDQEVLRRFLSDSISASASKLDALGTEGERPSAEELRAIANDLLGASFEARCQGAGPEVWAALHNTAMHLGRIADGASWSPTTKREVLGSVYGARDANDEGPRSALHILGDAQAGAKAAGELKRSAEPRPLERGSVSAAARRAYEALNFHFT